MFIGDGAKLVRDAFALAKEKAPAIIFIDELDAIGTKRFDSEKSGDREVQRTMLELLNQMMVSARMIGSRFLLRPIVSTSLIPLCCAVVVLIGKSSFPMPNEESRAKILQFMQGR